MPACAMGIVCPAMVRLVDRGKAEAAFEDAVTMMEALPEPDEDASVAHEAPLDAVQEQFAPLASTLTPAKPPAVANGLDSKAASRVTLQGVAS